MKIPNLLTDVRYYFENEPRHIRHKVLRIMIKYCKFRKFFPLPDHEEKKQLKRKLETKIKRKKRGGLFISPMETERSSITIPVDLCDQDYSDLEIQYPSKAKLKEALHSVCENTSKKTITEYFTYLKDNYQQKDYKKFNGWLEEDKADLPFSYHENYKHYRKSKK